MKKLHLFALLLATCLLTGCGGIAWNLSNRVAELPESCIGVDIMHPVGDALYVPQGQEKMDRPSLVITQVPEVRYVPRTRLTSKGDWAFMERLTAADVQPTGRLLWVQLPPPSGSMATMARVLPAKPDRVRLAPGRYRSEPALIAEEDARLYRTLAPKDIVTRRLVRHEGSPKERQDMLRMWSPGWGGGVNPKGLIRLSSTRSAWGAVANAASAPLYVVDCALGIATNAAAIAIALPLAPLTAPFLQQQPEPKESSAN